MNINEGSHSVSQTIKQGNKHDDEANSINQASPVLGNEPNKKSA